MGYTQVTWDNESGNEKEPEAATYVWDSLTESQKAAVMVLGYTQTTWDDVSGKEIQPATVYKYWVEMSSCTTAAPWGKCFHSALNNALHIVLITHSN